MRSKASYFSSGPSQLSPYVLKELQSAILLYQGTGVSLLELHHRSEEALAMINNCQASLRELLQVPSDFKILLVGCGASLAFATLALALRDKTQAFLLTGHWSKRAYEEANRVGAKTSIWAQIEPESLSLDKFKHLPNFPSDFLHYTSNETANGVRIPFEVLPQTCPLIADVSSEVGSAAFSWQNYAAVYFSCTKNLGVAGLHVIIMKQELIEALNESTANILNLKLLFEHNSLYSSLPLLPVYATYLTAEEQLRKGGVEFFQLQSDAKAELVYKVIDTYPNFYRNRIAKPFRSKNNIVFNLPSSLLGELFLQTACSYNLLGLSGYRSLGGVRVGLYNAVEFLEVAVLADFMVDFANKYAN